MPTFSRASKDKLATCETNLRLLFNEIIKRYDCVILCGHRRSEEQDELYRTGRSKLKGGKSKHNKTPSMAVDVAPYPIPKRWGVGNTKELAKFYHFSGFVKGVAESMGIGIRCGCDWDSDNDFNDQTFDDLVHFEIYYY